MERLLLLSQEERDFVISAGLDALLRARAFMVKLTAGCDLYEVVTK